MEMTSARESVPFLLAVASDLEARAVCGGPAPAGRPWEPMPMASSAGRGLWILVTGVGKAAAAGGVAHALSVRRFRGVISVGIAGSLPGPDAPPLLSVVAATAASFADDGIMTSAGLRDLAAAGFPPFASGGMASPAPLLDVLAPLATRTGVVATVSAGSGTDALAREVAERTGAIAEGMEGAAVALAAERLGVAWGELRVISNTTGERSRQVWDLAGSLEALGRVIGGLGTRLSEV